MDCSYQCDGEEPCTVSCKGLKPGVYSFVMDPDCHSSIMDDTMTLSTERGGVLRLNPQTLTMECSSKSKGSMSQVDIDHGIIEYHTHPTSCEAWTHCGISAPSALDMQNILMDSDNGNKVHIVFSRDSTYVISVGATLVAIVLRAAKLGKRAETNLQEAIHTIFDKKQRDLGVKLKADRDTGEYHRFIRDWSRTAKDIGFNVDVIPDKGDGVSWDRDPPVISLTLK